MIYPRREALNLRRWLAFLWLLVLTAGTFASLWLKPGMDIPLLLPGLSHWLGTDLLGNDVFLRIVEGGGWTVGIAGAACAISVMIGTAWGIAAGFFHGRASSLLTRLLDVALAVPSLLMALVWIAAFGPGHWVVIAAVGAGGVPTFARLARAESAQIATREYVLASRSLGANSGDVIRRHLLPNMAPALAAYAMLHLGWALTNTAALTFLGFGGSLSAADWGSMLGEARLVFWQAPWQALAAGAAIAITVLAAQQLGERRTEPA
jgi:peptide/nickel transport system permease protein